jgi:UDP-hydrolysing UDP-N-acetyl-D-glucosamine 2-epimerase
MIGDGWDGDPSTRPTSEPEVMAREARRVCVVTGSRAEFGLLRPIMHAVARRSELELAVIAAGSHLISPAETFREVKAEFNIADIVPMQIAGRTGRIEDAQSVARGIGRFARAFDTLRPDWVVVLGDRIEAFAAASGASIGGFAVAHVHGGDRAEGVADEAMRHAISKLSHLHLAATKTSAERLVRMGERPEHVRVVGSPAIDGLASMEAQQDEVARVVVLLHPIGRPSELEEADAAGVLEAASIFAGGKERVLALFPNHDAGREGIVRAIEVAGVRAMTHMARPKFVGMLRAMAQQRSVLIGNSSAGLIECAALGVRVVNLGPRQAGRERAENVVDVEHAEPVELSRAIQRAAEKNLAGLGHPYGDGRAGERCAATMVEVNPHDPGLLRKQNTY